jgi:hypothetical protein
MLYQDKFGNILHPDEVDELSLWEIDEIEIHVFGEI